MRRGNRWLLAAGSAVAICGLSATPALAKAINPAKYAVFSQCPTSIAGLNECVYSESTSGSISIGNTTVTVGTQPLIFQGGVLETDTSSTFEPAANGDTLSQVPLTVPGGLLGLTPPSLFPQPLQGIIDQAIDSANGVTATAELVGTPTFSLANFFTGNGTTVSLPVQIQLNNPFLGSSCYIGSAADPVTFNLTTGTTSPPAGVSPLTGSPGVLKFKDGGDRAVSKGVSLVDNTFSVPGATGCGGVFSALIDPVVDEKEGIPADAGVSSATLDGTSEIANPKTVKQEGY